MRLGGINVICYCVFRADSGNVEGTDFVEVQDQNGRPIVLEGGVRISAHPTLKGAWRLGPFYIADNSVSEFPDGLVR